MVSVIITAAGSSSRMGGAKKEFFSLGCGTVLSETAKRFLQTIDISQMVVTYASASASENHSASAEASASGDASASADVSADEEASASAARTAFFADSEMETLVSKTKLMFVPGGATRQDSVRNALEALAETWTGAEASASADTLANANRSASAGESHIVLVHDGARPFVTSEIIRAVVDATKKYGAAVPAVVPVDTLKEKDDGDFITRHLTRSQLAAVQTPQGFHFTELLEAHRKAMGDGKTYTDDSEIWGAYCGEVKIVAGDIANKKITYASDLPRAAHGESHAASKSTAPHFRIGFGYDLHRLVDGRKLIIGGVTIPFEKGEDGHSDGDVLLHAVTDALLGAAALGDIGSFFPPNDDTWKDADSKRLIQIAWEKIKSGGWTLGNLDCVVKLEKPKLLPFREEIRASIANALGVSADKIFVKAKTSEKLGDVGHGEAIEAWASCIIY